METKDNYGKKLGEEPVVMSKLFPDKPYVPVSLVGTVIDLKEFKEKNERIERGNYVRYVKHLNVSTSQKRNMLEGVIDKKEIEKILNLESHIGD